MKKCMALTTNTYTSSKKPIGSTKPSSKTTPMTTIYKTLKTKPKRISLPMNWKTKLNSASTTKSKTTRSSVKMKVFLLSVARNKWLALNVTYILIY